MADSLFHDFLVEHAKFPFPPCSLGSVASSTDISELDVGLLDNEWKAHHGVRDNDLAEKLCEYLKATLGEMPLTEELTKALLPLFLPALSVRRRGRMVTTWLDNPNEAQVSVVVFPREFKLSLWDRAEGY
jgi:hypothetical protein